MKHFKWTQVFIKKITTWSLMTQLGMTGHGKKKITKNNSLDERQRKRPLNIMHHMKAKEKLYFIWQKHWGPHRNWCLLASLTVNQGLVHREIWLIAQSTLLICCPLYADCKVPLICSSGTVNTYLSVCQKDDSSSFAVTYYMHNTALMSQVLWILKRQLMEMTYRLFLFVYHPINWPA